MGFYCGLSYPVKAIKEYGSLSISYNMQWKVNSRKTIYDLKGNDLKVSIHKIQGLDGWFLSCHPLNIKQMNLKTEDFNEAVKQSQIIIMGNAKELYESACDFVKNVYDNNEFTKW